MKTRAEYYHRISDQIENNITDPIEILNQLYNDYVKTFKKRKRITLFEPLPAHNTVDEIIKKFSNLSTEDNKLEINEMLSVFVTFFPKLIQNISIQFPLNIQPDTLPNLIKLKFSSKDFEALAIKGKIDGLQELVLITQDKGFSLIDKLCEEIKTAYSKSFHQDNCTVSLGDLGLVISQLAKSAQARVLEVLYRRFREDPNHLGNIKALIKLIPQFNLPDELEQISKNLQKSFEKYLKAYWQGSAALLNAIDKYYPLSTESRHKVIQFLLSQSNKSEALMALKNLSYSIAMESDGGLAVITQLRAALKTNSHTGASNAAKVLNNLTHIILKLPDSSDILKEFAHFIVSIPEYYRFSYWEPAISNWASVISIQSDRGMAFFNILTTTMLSNICQNRSIIFEYIFFWKDLLVNLPDGGLSCIKSYCKALEEQQKKFEYDPAHPQGEICILIRLFKNFRDIFVRFPDDVIAIINRFMFFWEKVKSCNNLILEAIASLGVLGEKATSILQPLMSELIEYNEKESLSFKIPFDANKKKFLNSKSDIIAKWSTKEATIFFNKALCTLFNYHPQQVSFIWTIIQFVQSHKDDMHSTAQTLGGFYTMFSEQSLLLTHVPVKDVANVIQEYASIGIR